jgi:hypothetical protein
MIDLLAETGWRHGRIAILWARHQLSASSTQSTKRDPYEEKHYQAG